MAHFDIQAGASRAARIIIGVTLVPNVALPPSLGNPVTTALSISNAETHFW